MAKQKYISIDKMLKQNFHYNILIGARSNGKSFAVKRHCLSEAFRNPEHKFVYLRRYQIESRAMDVEGYFRDAPVMDITAGAFTKIVVFRGCIYFANTDPETGKTVRGACCGYVSYLSNEQHFKSQNYNDVSEIIFEEFIAENNGYIYREHERLQSFISTVARKRKIRVWMIGNSISRTCPYFSAYSLDHIHEMTPGSLDTYEHHTDQVYEDGTPVIIRIGVYFTEQPQNNSKMFFGTFSKMTTGGSWQTREYPHLPYHYRDCKKVYELLLRWEKFLFKIEVIRSPESEYMLFVHPHSGKTEGLRMLDKEPSPSPLITKKLQVVKRGDALVSELIRKNKIYFSDNLTGSDWEGVIKEMGTL